MNTEIENNLKEPFPPEDIEWRAGPTNNKENPTRCIALAYITARAVMDRLDDVFGVGGWQSELTPLPKGGFKCKLSCLIDGKWISKEDVSDETDFEAIKGAASGALKRCSVQWKISRYLYDLENVWVPCEKKGRSVYIPKPPPLPSWALPSSQSPKEGRRPLESKPSPLRSEARKTVMDEPKDGMTSWAEMNSVKQSADKQNNAIETSIARADKWDATHSEDKAYRCEYCKGWIDMKQMEYSLNNHQMKLCEFHCLVPLVAALKKAKQIPKVFEN